MALSHAAESNTNHVHNLHHLTTTTTTTTTTNFTTGKFSGVTVGVTGFSRSELSRTIEAGLTTGHKLFRHPVNTVNESRITTTSNEITATELHCIQKSYFRISKTSVDQFKLLEQ